MSTSKQRRQLAVRYWESRRVAFNLLMVPPALFGWIAYYAAQGAVNPVKESGMAPALVLGWFVVAALLANLAYSVAYALEYLFFGAEREGLWTMGGRAATFTTGSLVAFGAAFLGGAKIASLMLFGL